MTRDVLITGATGLIGGEIASWLASANNRRVWCVVRATTHSEAAGRLRKRFTMSGRLFNWSNMVALPGNTGRPLLGIAYEALQYLSEHCEHVIHCAAETSFADNSRCVEENWAGTENVLDICRLFGRQVALFHMSSAVVCSSPGNSVVNEDGSPEGFYNGYVLSKRQCEQMVLSSRIKSVILRPSIVIAEGVRAREFARSILWVMPVIRSLGALPMTGDEQIDAVSVRYVAEAVVQMLDRPLQRRIYHISAGPGLTASWRELFESFTRNGHDYSKVRFDPDLDWDSFGVSDARLLRLKKFVNYYLPFIRAGVVYDNGKLRNALGAEFPRCRKVTDYCAQVLDLFTEREAFEEAGRP